MKYTIENGEMKRILNEITHTVYKLNNCEFGADEIDRLVSQAECLQSLFDDAKER